MAWTETAWTLLTDCWRPCLPLCEPADPPIEIVPLVFGGQCPSVGQEQKLLPAVLCLDILHFVLSHQQPSPSSQQR